VSARRDLVPAALTALLGFGILAVRPPLPVDETRYLEVFRESLAGNPLLLRLCGEPYAEKPPLLFWLARLLTELGLPSDLALRSVPVLATALGVWFAARVGRRAGLELAGWMQAALLLPLLAGELLIFDPLLACALWGAVLAWTSGRERAFTLATAAALLAKGPVAFLFLVPFLWSAAPLRTGRTGQAGRPGHTGPAAGPGLRRTLALSALALVPLAAWALAAARIGGPEFARALLWDRWAGRVVDSFAHRRALWFYAPVLLVGALPATLVLLGRPSFDVRGGEVWARRLAWSVAGLVVAFTLFSGKQAHYMVPLAPALALLAARAVERPGPARGRLELGLALELGLLVLFLSAAAFGLGALDDLDTITGPAGRAFVAHGARPTLLAGAAVAALALGWTLRARTSPAGRLATAVLGAGGALLALHLAAGRLFYPHTLATALAAEPARPMAFLGTSHQGLVELLTTPRPLAKVDDEEALLAWATAHPDGLMWVDPAKLESELPAEFELVAEDVVHRCAVHLLRPRAPRTASTAGSRRP